MKTLYAVLVRKFHVVLAASIALLALALPAWSTPASIDLTQDGTVQSIGSYTYYARGDTSGATITPFTAAFYVGGANHTASSTPTAGLDNGLNDASQTPGPISFSSGDLTNNSTAQTVYGWIDVDQRNGTSGSSYRGLVDVLLDLGSVYTITGVVVTYTDSSGTRWDTTVDAQAVYTSLAMPTGDSGVTLLGTATATSNATNGTMSFTGSPIDARYIDFRPSMLVSSNPGGGSAGGRISEITVMGHSTVAVTASTILYQNFDYTATGTVSSGSSLVVGSGATALNLTTGAGSPGGTALSIFDRGSGDRALRYTDNENGGASPNVYGNTFSGVGTGAAGDRYIVGSFDFKALAVASGQAPSFVFQINGNNMTNSSAYSSVLVFFSDAGGAALNVSYNDGGAYVANVFPLSADTNYRFNLVADYGNSGSANHDSYSFTIADLDAGIVVYRSPRIATRATADIVPNRIVFYGGGGNTIYNASPFFEIDNINFVTTDSLFHWGVTGHPEMGDTSPAYATVVPLSGSSSTSPTGQLDLVRELGCDYYRIGDGDDTLDALLPLATAQNINLLVTLKRVGDIYSTSRTDTDVYNDCKARAQAFATKYQGAVSHVELDNELDNSCIKSSAYSGAATTDYDDAKYARVMSALKGLSDGIAAGDPSMTRIINAGWYHYGYIDRLIGDGVNFDAVGWHWYSQMGSMSRVMQKLSSYGKPIWVTEIDRVGGSYQADQLFSDNFSADTVGAAPSTWTASGNWQVVDYSGQRLAADADNNSTPNGRSLSRVLASNTQGNWELNYDYDWKYGGTPSYGSKDLRIDCDVTDGSGNGYRLRAYQGNGGDTANNNAILLIYRLTGGSPTLLTQGPGYNDGGFGTRSLGAPVLKHLCFRRDRTNNQLTVQYNDPNETDAKKVWKVSATANDSNYDDFTQVTINVGGFGHGEQPMIDNLSFTHAYIDENAQEQTLAQMLEEIHGFPQVETLMTYELLDEPNLGTLNPEAYYGLCSLTKDEQGNRIFEHRKPAFYAFADAIAAHGFIQPAVADGQVIDDAYDYPAMKYAPTTGVWTGQSSLPDYYYEGYRDDGDVNKSSANYVRFYAYIPTSGNYEVSIRQPADSGNASSVPVSIHHAGTTASATVDQRTDGDWQVIGTYYFNAWQPSLPYGGTSWENATDAAYLQVGNTGTSGHVLIDAVRFRPAP